MNKKVKKCVILASLIMASLLISYALFGSWWSSEYYRGFNWHAGEKWIDLRLRIKHVWYDGDDGRECLTEDVDTQEYTKTRVQEQYWLDKERGTLKKIERTYTTRDPSEMERIYQEKVADIKKKLGESDDYELSYYFASEWKTKHSTIQVIKDDSQYEDLNKNLRVVYMDSDMYNEPYFTEAHMNKGEFEMMLDKFYCISSPHFEQRQISQKKEADYSNYKLRPSKETSKVVALMNKYLFGNDADNVHRAQTVAESEGFTEKKQLTVDWVMEHPVRAVKIFDELTWNNDIFKDKAWVDQNYESLTEEEKQRA
ncbi:MAG: hypothetical protein K5744_03005 [Eubacterium sp.]|nr:hypothetical protein [Eubacterium sp.]